MAEHKLDARKGLPPSNNGKRKTNIMDELVCHFCRESIDYATALRVPAYDHVKNGSRYLVHAHCTRGLPVLGR